MDEFIHTADMPEHPEVEYRSTGPRGGDAGHGGYTTLRIAMDSGAKEVRVLDYRGRVLFDSERPYHANGTPDVIELTVRGDWEMSGLDVALKQLGLHLLQRDLNNEQRGE